MQIKLGIIGPQDSVDKISRIALEFKNKVSVVPFVYQRKEESVELMKQCQQQVDVVLFSGHIPYYIVKYAGVIEKPTFYIPRVGTSILKALFEMEQRQIDYRRMSIDSIQESSLSEVVDEMDLCIDHYYMIAYEENIEYEKLAEKHFKLWQEGKINIAITGLSKTHDELKEKGVPVMKLTPTTFLIREYITKAIYAADINLMKGSQIGIQIVKLRIDRGRASSEYDFLKLRNEVEQQIIDYTKGILGSLFPFGRDEYMIFSTRGVIDQSIGEFCIENCVVAAGVGYGQTVYGAETNARTALEYAMKKEESATFIVDEAGCLTGPVSSGIDEALTYAIKVDDDAIIEIAERIKLSPAHVAKIKSLMIKTKSDTFDANDIAMLLSVSLRSARRILGAIVEGEYGEIVAKESTSSTGRPRQIYKINF